MAQVKMSILCDFDGTIALIDTAEYILEKFALGDWREIERRLESGELSIEESMKLQFEMISLPRSEIMTEIDKIIQIRPGFESLLKFCSSCSSKLKVTSAGLDFYIHHFMEINGWSNLTEIIAPRVTEDNGIQFRFPEKRYPSSHNFKEDEVSYEQARGGKVAYIGDGTSDQWAALRSDLAFVVKGSKLDALLKKNGTSYVPFTDFQTVVERLEEEQTTSSE
jgi:2,3-diketo-5-methylthio-1-phosphopentane phosphatase